MIKEVSGFFKQVSRRLQESVKVVSRVVPECFKGVSRKFQENVKVFNRSLKPL